MEIQSKARTHSRFAKYRVYLSSTVINLLGRGVNFLLILQIVSYLGASAETDWYFFLFGIINIINSITYYAIESDMVPTLADMDSFKKIKFVRSYYKLSVLFGVLLQTIGIPLCMQVPGIFKFHTLMPLNHLLIVSSLMFAQPMFNYFSAIYASILQNEGRIALPIVNLSIRSLVVILFLLVPSRNKILYLIGAYAVGELIRTLVLRYSVRQNIFGDAHAAWPKWRECLNHFHGLGLTVANMTLINLLLMTDYIMAGNLGAGKATLVEYVGLLKTIPAMVLNGVLVYFFGRWVKQAKSMQWSHVRKQLFTVFTVGSFLAGTVILLSDLVLPLMFRQKYFDPNQIEDVKKLFFWFMISSVFYLAIYTLHKIFFAFQKYLFLVKVGVVILILNYGLNYILMQKYNVEGIAMGTTIIEALTTCYLYFMAKKTVKSVI